MEETSIVDSAESRLWRFVLGRAVHDLNNCVGGILSVTETHLARQIDDPELRESLELVGQSGRAGWDLIVAVTDLLTAEDGAAELTRLSDLLAYLARGLKLFLPRGIEVATPSFEGDTTVRVNAKLLLVKLLALIQSDSGNNHRSAASQRELALTLEPSVAWLIYRSTNRSGPELTSLSRALFSQIQPALKGLKQHEQKTEFEMALGLVIVKVPRSDLR